MSRKKLHDEWTPWCVTFRGQWVYRGSQDGCRAELRGFLERHPELQSDQFAVVGYTPGLLLDHPERLVGTVFEPMGEE
jgi:hypothetical protein